MKEGVLELGDIPLQNGGVLPRARLAYRTYGRLNAAHNNAILFATPFPSRDDEQEWFIGPGHALDPATYFIIVPNLFGNGRSSSPSNTTDVFAPGTFPLVTVHDNVVQQRRLICDEFGIERLCLAMGYSLGGQQAYHWAALYPDRVDRLAAICSAARISLHNQVFLRSLRSALTADPAWKDGWFDHRPDRGLKAMAHAFAAWGLSHQFYRERRFSALKHPSLDAFLAAGEAFFLIRDANDLVSMLETWRHGDISQPEFAGSLEAALARISCRVLLMPGSTDFYFPAEDNRSEAALMAQAEVLPIPSVWGHRAGNPRQSADDAAFIDAALIRFLSH